MKILSFKQFLIENDSLSNKVKDNLQKWIQDDSLKQYRDILNKVAKLVDADNHIEASKIFDASELRYELPQTGTFLKDLADEQHISTTIGKDWGTKAGTYIAWRSGEVGDNPNGIFFSPFEADAKAYSHNERSTNKYEITIKNPLVIGWVYDAISKLTNKPIQYWFDKRDSANDSVKFIRELDSKVAKLAKKEGYDSICYTKPAPPAKRELVVLDKKNVKTI